MLGYKLVEGVAKVQEEDDQAADDGDRGVFSYKRLHTTLPGCHRNEAPTYFSLFNIGVPQV